jgi:hypothetical protein
MISYGSFVTSLTHNDDYEQTEINIFYTVLTDMVKIELENDYSYNCVYFDISKDGEKLQEFFNHVFAEHEKLSNVHPNQLKLEVNNV